ncbi:acyl carrier protein [Flavobacterium hydatis]|jgi:acyl carrier protein|uniref:Acyl carrier protein n=1 Tax=Flavobacterium hydatis TaxID=991 RepID=A0A086AP30_FLAHY|nr:phosphopantetheine-binding protein [Flavobacterium hydatis]KFF18444.1 acyl carrier protein [Flavobacterium hydatis]OXA96809.1 acyl carrier protein [Flavobacterium hydatis]
MKELLLLKINEVLTGKNLPIVTSINHDTTLRDGLGLDSIDLAELTVRIEEETDIDIFSNGIITTVGEILDVLENK